MTATFTDSYGDKLEVENFGYSDRENGLIRLTQAGKSSVFGLQGAHRVPMAQELLKGLDSHIIEGTLPEVKVDTQNGVGRVAVGTFVGDVSEAEFDYRMVLARRNLAMAQVIRKALTTEEAARQARLAEAAKINKRRHGRRDELAKELSGLDWAKYSTLPGSTARAVDRIIELEEAAK